VVSCHQYTECPLADDNLMQGMKRTIPVLIWSATTPRAITAFAVAGLALLLAYSAWRTHDWAIYPVESFAISMHKLNGVIGQASMADGAVSVSQLDPDGHAVLAARTSPFRAADFPILRYRVSGVPEYLQLALFWRTRQAPAQLHTRALQQANGSTQTLRLGRSLKWRGDVLETGITIQSATGFSPPHLALDIRVISLGFESDSMLGNLRAVLTRWLAPEPWSGRSANTIDTGPPNDTIAPVLFLLISTGLAILVLAVSSFRNTRRLAASAMVVSLLAWVLLSGWWQHRLWQQNAYSRARFSGLTQDQKTRADNDWRLYSQVTEIKSAIQKHGAGGRVFIHTRQGHYQRERTYYHLLPLNSRYVASRAALTYMNRGDYLLLDPKQSKKLWMTRHHLLLTVRGNRTSFQLQPLVAPAGWKLFFIADKQ